MHKYFLAESAKDYAATPSLFKEYAAVLNINLDFQHFDEELKNLKKMYALPHGGIVLAGNEAKMAGCVGIKNITQSICVPKRMYVLPSFQSQGLGKELSCQAILPAKRCNCEMIRLDTLNHMLPAIHLYKKMGFYELAPYYYNPISAAMYFEKKI